MLCLNQKSSAPAILNLFNVFEYIRQFHNLPPPMRQELASKRNVCQIWYVIWQPINSKQEIWDYLDICINTARSTWPSDHLIMVWQGSYTGILANCPVPTQSSAKPFFCNQNCSIALRRRSDVYRSSLGKHHRNHAGPEWASLAQPLSVPDKWAYGPAACTQKIRYCHTWHPESWPRHFSTSTSSLACQCSLNMLSVCRIEASHIHEQVDEYLPQDRMRSGTFCHFHPKLMIDN